MLKLGNNVKMVSFARVADRPGLVEDYERIDRTFRNPLFRAARMRALIREEPWHRGNDRAVRRVSLAILH